jgi:hypothetical protein
MMKHQNKLVVVAFLIAFIIAYLLRTNGYV